jgi:hypothetical protein
MTVMTTSVLYCDQTPSKEGSIVWIMVGMSWDVSAGPRTMPVVQNIKMIVVIPNKNLCSRERNKGPLELQEGEKGTFECSHGRRVNRK